MKILAFGDSILKGVVQKDGRYTTIPNCFASLVENDSSLDIENNGRFGHTVQRGNAFIDSRIKDIQDPNVDAIVLEYGGNDCDYDWRSISNNPKASYSCNTPIPLFISTYTKIINSIKTLGKEVYLLSLPPIDGERYFDHISRGLDKNAILDWIGGSTTTLTSWHEMYNLTVLKIGALTNTKVIDITSPFFEQKNYSSFLCLDGIHPNEKGHALISDAIVKQINLLKAS